jgi:nitroreductase
MLQLSFTETAVRFFLSVILAASFVFAGQDSLIPLPKPQLDRGRPMMQVLKDRKSSRVFDSKPLPQQELANILWAAFGVNRPEKVGRTAPSAMDMQEIDVYAALPDGLFLYEAKTHSLKKILGKDIRELTGKQPFAKDAPLNVVLVADYSRMAKMADSTAKKLYAAADAAYISQNIYFYCASEGLATVVRGSVDRAPLAAAMQLRSDQQVIFAQTVGYPKK